jgi:putative phosphoribosyl transferase
MPATARLAVGGFGASTGAAAALHAAADRPDRVAAVVSRSGRPDLAGSALARVRAATLLLVGGADTAVLGMNQVALRRLTAAADADLIVIPGATHLFEEPGALERVAGLATAWFERRLCAGDGVRAAATAPAASAVRRAASGGPRRGAAS